MEVNIQIRPMQMFFVVQFNILDLSQRFILKPWKIFVRDEIFFCFNQNPYSKRGYI